MSSSNSELNPTPGEPSGNLMSDVPGGDEIKSAVEDKHATHEVIMHALYGFYFNRKACRYIARMMGKSHTTVSRWVKRWESDRISGRIQTDPQYRKFNSEHREWIKTNYEDFPLSFIDEACIAFEEQFKMTISSSHLWCILSEAGFTRKVCSPVTCLGLGACCYSLTHC